MNWDRSQIRFQILPLNGFWPLAKCTFPFESLPSLPPFLLSSLPPSRLVCVQPPPPLIFPKGKERLYTGFKFGIEAQKHRERWGEKGAKSVARCSSPHIDVSFPFSPRKKDNKKCLHVGQQQQQQKQAECRKRSRQLNKTASNSKQQRFK